MKRVAPFVLGVLVAAACGETLPATTDVPPAQDDAGSSGERPDAASVPDARPPGDAASSGRIVVAVPSVVGMAPAKPVECPFVDCPDDEELCKDEACESTSTDFEIVGGISLANGKCTGQAANATDAFMTRSLTPDRLRQHATVSLQLDAITTAGRTIAAIGADVDREGERVELFARTTASGTTLELCERAATATRCTPPVLVPQLPATVHLYGVATTADPPNALFALGFAPGNCDPVSVIDVTRPFASGDLRAFVGCVGDPGAGDACMVTFDSAGFLLRSE